MFKRTLSICVLSLATIIAGASTSDARTYRDGNVLRVENNTGGFIRQRQIEISQLRRSRTPVELGGAHCISSCTMYLSLPQACVEPETKFGFHAPSFFGIPGSGRKYVSLMAAYYPQDLREWYMKNAAHHTISWVPLTGMQLNRHFGIRLCDNR